MLRNYTSAVSTEHSLAFIERRLMDFGATQILKQIGPDKKLAGLCFMLTIDGRSVPFKLPTRVEACEKILRQDVRRPRNGTFEKIKEQAERTAWKLMADWVDTQLTLIKLDQIKLFEAFMPFLYDPATKQTYFERLESNKFKGILPAPEER